MKRAQLKSYSPRSTFSIYSGIVNHHSKEENIDDISRISRYTPVIHEFELNKLAKLFSELMDEISIIQDYTFLHDEHFGVCARGMDEDGLWVQQKLIDIWSIGHHLSGLNIVFIVEKDLLRIHRKVDSLISMSVDKITTNRRYNKMLILDKVGNNFDAPELKTFMKKIRHLVSNSDDVKRLFRQSDSEDFLAGYAAIRWWNDWVQQVQAFNMGIDKIKHIADILQSNDKCAVSLASLINLMEYKRSYVTLSMQIAASIDYATPFCKATFNFEGDADGLSFVTGD